MCNPWDTTIPVLSEMSLSKRVITHIDANNLYAVVLRPGHGLVAAFGETLLCDQCWADENIWSVGTSADIQQRKCRDPRVRAELLKLKQTMDRHRIPTENVLFIDCSTELAINAVVASVRESLAMDKPIEPWPNDVGLALTMAFREIAWDD